MAAVPIDEDRAPHAGTGLDVGSKTLIPAPFPWFEPLRACSESRLHGLTLILRLGRSHGHDQPSHAA
jgi:hypothetical protein